MTGRDGELDRILQDEDLSRLARDLRDAAPDAVPSDAFRQRLRRELLSRHPGSFATARWLPGGATRILLTAAAVLVIGGIAVRLSSPLPKGSVALVTATSPIEGRIVPPAASTIEVRFNVPMQSASVLDGLSIEPATAVTASWSGTTLDLTPDHPLAADTPYTVSFPASSLITKAGGHASSPLVIPFTTGPGPAGPLPAGPGPSPSPTPLAETGPSTALQFALDGSLLLDQAAPGLPAGEGDLVDAPLVGPSVVLLRDVAAFQRSPTALTVAAVTDESGSPRLMLASETGETLLTSAISPTSPLAWLGDGAIVYVNGTTVESIPAQGGTPLPRAVLPAGATMRCAPYGQACAVLGGQAGTPASPGLLQLSPNTLYSLPSWTPLAALPSQSIAFSPDGTEAVMATPTGLAVCSTLACTPTGVPTSVPPLTAGSSGLAVSDDGTLCAEEVATPTGDETLALSESAVLARVPNAGDPAFSPDGSLVVERLGAADEPVEDVPLPASQSSPPEGGVGPLLSALITSQTGGAAFPSADAPGTSIPVIPGAVSGSVAAIATGPSEMTVTLRYLDPSPPRQVLLEVARWTESSSWMLSSLSPVVPEPAAGPHVLSVSSPSQGAFRIVFDSDLDASSVGPACTVSGAQGTVPSAVTIDPATKTVMVVALGAVADPSVSLSTGLRDLNGDPLAEPYFYSPSLSPSGSHQ